MSLPEMVHACLLTVLPALLQYLPGYMGTSQMTQHHRAEHCCCQHHSISPMQAQVFVLNAAPCVGYAFAAMTRKLKPLSACCATPVSQQKQFKPQQLGEDCPKQCLTFLPQVCTQQGH